MVFDPKKTALPTLVLTPISAVEGLMDTAPTDQFEVPLKLSDIGTLGAPERVLALAATSVVAPMFPLVKFHCCTCGPGIVMV